MALKHKNLLWLNSHRYYNWKPKSFYDLGFFLLSKLEQPILVIYMNCKNCDTELQGSFCHNCGQRHFERLTMRHIVANSIGYILNYDNSFFHTLKTLLIKPELVVKEFIQGKRVSYFSPFQNANSNHFFAGIDLIVFTWCSHKISRCWNYFWRKWRKVCNHF